MAEQKCKSYQVGEHLWGDRISYHWTNALPHLRKWWNLLSGVVMIHDSVDWRGAIKLHFLLVGSFRLMAAGNTDRYMTIRLTCPDALN